MSVALVTDSTAYLPPDLTAELGITVVPLHVSVDGRDHTEGVDIDDADLLRSLKRSRSLTSSRPSPQAFREVYERVAADGATHVVSAHLAGGLSGTCDSARLAAGVVDVPVEVVDSGSMGMTLGHAVLAGARRAVRGADVEDVARTVRRVARAGELMFVVHTLEHLRRGGRIGNAAALVGSALAVRPLLRLVDGRIEPVEKVRTTGRALARLVDLAAEACPGERVAVTVHHLADEVGAHKLAARLDERLGDRLVEDTGVRPIGAVAAIHLGPGAVAVSVSPCDAEESPEDHPGST
ncbi:DegV family protein [Mobilicoccus pelagius]|uniref:DegV family protein n=1 Tax=Mobilicoccus pelagius NBRC 104925 TaxID=1089455 RepID=H5UNU9_9MICO|nr:DegV family protein [Mobilicoccus pelagius]GAB47407.1 hypothetical protein MOPEL_009_00980 [Mobilicoccus pelagius NBRC 104925]